jgi:probable F420-dependent oxidoreductase
MMRYSVHIPTAASGLAHPVPFADVDEILQIIAVAEQLGYDGVWGNYHVTTQAYVREVWPSPPDYFDTTVVLATAAGRTARIELGTALLIPAFYQVPVLAKLAATLDRVSHGRFKLGVGLGAYREEFEAIWPRASATARRGVWLDEALEALRMLFDDGHATYRGEYVQFVNVDCYPRPVQNPFPLYVGGHNLQAIERAARWGQGWLPGWQPIDEMSRRIQLLRARTLAYGRPEHSVEVAPQLSVTIDETDFAAERRYWGSGLVRHRQSLDYTRRDLDQQVAANLIGSPATIRQKVADLEGIGVNHCCALWFSTDTVAEMISQMEWFAGEVMGAGKQ